MLVEIVLNKKNFFFLQNDTEFIFDATSRGSIFELNDCEAPIYYTSSSFFFNLGEILVRFPSLYLFMVDIVRKNCQRKYKC